MYLFKEYARTAMIKVDSKRNSDTIIFFKTFCVSDYTLLFSSLCLGHWNIANYDSSFTALNDSGGLRNHKT